MLPITLIADSGATKTEWCLLIKAVKKFFSPRASALIF
jgi:hypothetical protein